ncbi:MAG TPA: metallophosphoesterase [Methanomassiliicoccales archaeon]|nr:metallophosphoesterase [Methanomassiliicoccales archaeon]
MLIAAMGDVHGRQNIGLVKAASDRLERCDLILLAGDTTDSNDFDQFGEVVTALRQGSDAELIAVFGNEEYDESRSGYKQRYPMIYLEEEARELVLDDVKLKIVGSTGALDRPTWWQRTNIPEVWKRYKDRTVAIETLLDRGDADVLLLLTHYAPTYATLKGEREGAWPEMGSQHMENVLMEKRPDLAIHAHAHRGDKLAVLSRKQRSLEDFKAAGASVPVYNVSLPARGTVSFFEIGREENGVSISELQ